MYHTDIIRIGLVDITTERCQCVKFEKFFFLCLLPKNENRYSVLGIIRCPDQVSSTWVLEVKCPGCKGDHLPPFSTDLKNTLSCTSTLPYAFMACTGKISLLHN